jgi:hypothetical protein
MWKSEMACRVVLRVSGLVREVPGKNQAELMPPDCTAQVAAVYGTYVWDCEW